MRAASRPSRFSPGATLPARSSAAVRTAHLALVVAFGLSPIACVAGPESPADDAAAFEREVRPFFTAHCVDCHGEFVQEGEFRLDGLAATFDATNAPLWAEIAGRINGGEMPPPPAPGEDPGDRPDEASIARVTGRIAERLRETRLARMAARGPVAHYRLSREEYEHAVEDLLGVRFDAAAPGAFSDDPRWHGFARIGSQLTLAPSHVEKYLAAAEEIVDRAFPDKPPEPIAVSHDAIHMEGGLRGRREDLEAAGLADKVRVLMWPQHKLTAVHPRRLPIAGVYRGRVTLSGVRPPGGPAPHLKLYSKTVGRTLFEADVLAPEGEPVTLEFETILPAGGVTVDLTNDVPGPNNLPRSGRSSKFAFTTLDDPRSRAPWQRKLTDDDGNLLYSLLIVDRIEWEGPIVPPEAAAARLAYWPQGESPETDPAAVRSALARFAAAAWRRPATEAEVDRYVGVVEQILANGSDFRTAYKSALAAVLTSKNFLYLVEGDAGQNRATLTDWELASRLSFFLWGSGPDDALRTDAIAGRLTDPAVRRGHVRRMLADPKAARFAESFPSQWLQLDRVGEFPPDTDLYPEYDDWLEESMIRETTGFFAEALRENLPARAFLDSNWTVLNGRLARHYGIDNDRVAAGEPRPHQMVKVALAPEDRRGGVLTQASVLSLTSDGTRHRPVHRGVWLSESLLGRTPDPPPPNVDAIEPNPPDGAKLTIRRQLAAHRGNPACAGCHRQIDPLGFAFENYDAIGRWRDVEKVRSGTGDDPPADASGELPDGRAFDGPEQFKTLLAGDPDPFAAALAGKLATYALRRVLTVDDRAAIARVAAAAESQDYRLRILIEELVADDLFARR